MSLLQIVEDEARVSHRVVAENTDNKQKNIAELIHKYREDFDEFGGCPFKTEALQTAGGKQEIKTYYLNEPQATFLMTLLRNKPIVVAFKKRLVKEFYSQREQLQTPSAPADINTVMLEMLKSQQQFMEVQLKQTDAILELAQSMQQVPQLVQQTQPTYIDGRARRKIHEEIRLKAIEQANEIGVSKETFAPAIWIELKRHFDVDDYQDLLQSQLKDVLHFIMFWEAKKPKFKSATSEYPFVDDKDIVQI